MPHARWILLITLRDANMYIHFTFALSEQIFLFPEQTAVEARVYRFLTRSSDARANCRKALAVGVCRAFIVEIF